MDKNTFKVINDEGKEITCNVLFTFDSEETGKSYICYTDNSKDAEGNTQVFASIFDPTKETTKLEPIETEKEWKIIEIVLKELQDEAKRQLAAVQDGDKEGDNHTPQEQ